MLNFEKDEILQLVNEELSPSKTSNQLMDDISKRLQNKFGNKIRSGKRAWIPAPFAGVTLRISIIYMSAGDYLAFYQTDVGGSGYNPYGPLEFNEFVITGGVRNQRITDESISENPDDCLIKPGEYGRMDRYTPYILGYEPGTLVLDYGKGNIPFLLPVALMQYPINGDFFAAFKLAPMLVKKFLFKNRN
jgi:ERG2 and Sigma1 receptor like protein